MRRKRIHGHKRVTRSPIKHKADYQHDESMHSSYPKNVMDRIVKDEMKENPKRDKNTIFETEKQRKKRKSEEREIGYGTEMSV